MSGVSNGGRTLRERDPVVLRGMLFAMSDELVYHERWDADWGIVYLNAEGHRLHEYNEETVVRWEIRTRCGLVVDGWTREQDDNKRWISLQAGLADRIARPCRRCFAVDA